MDKVRKALQLAAERMSLVDAFDRRAYHAIQDALKELDQAGPTIQPEPTPDAWALECMMMGGMTSWRLSWTRTGAGVCNRLIGPEHERPLFYADTLLGHKAVPGNE